MELILLLFAAPVIQIVLSVLRLTGKMPLPLMLIFAIAFFIGIAASFIAMGIVLDEIPASSGHGKCGMPGMAALFGGLFITFVSAPVIALICALINFYRMKSMAKI